MKKSLSAIFALITVALSGGLVYIQASGSKLLGVQTGSMTPSISKGSLVAVKRVPDSQLSVGDVITYTNPDNNRKTITHRIIQLPDKENGNRFITKGDANIMQDTPVGRKQILGKVEHKIPLMGYGADFVRKPLGLALIIYVPALVVVLGEMRRLATYYKSLQPYIAAGVKSRLLRSKEKRGGLAFAKIMSVVILLPLLLTIKTYAALTSNPAVLANSSFTVTVPSSACTGTGNNNTNTTVNVNGGGSSNNNVNVSNSNNQTATTGNATNSNNTNGGSATSGNATNCNSTNININITNP